MQIDSQEIDIKNRDKIFYPEYGITKGDVIDYYEKAADYILPFLKDRPLSLRRYPDGISKNGFFQKVVPDYFPDWIDTAEIDKKEGGTITQVICNNKATLIYLVNQGTISIHPWLSRLPDLNKPDRLIFDLDPPDLNHIGELISAAEILRKTLEETLGLAAFVMTTGGKGLHVICPLNPAPGFDIVHSFAKEIADYIVSKSPDIFTTKVRKNQREKRVFIDYLRNSYAQTSVAPYSVRAQQNATVATPLRWNELNKGGLFSGYYHIKNIFRRLNQIENPWEDFQAKAGELKEIDQKLNELV